jgi:hypothetical protein
MTCPTHSRTSTFETNPDRELSAKNLLSKKFSAIKKQHPNNIILVKM